MPATPPPAPLPEHEVQHNPIQDIRHVKEMAELPVAGKTQYNSVAGSSGGSVTPGDDQEAMVQKAFQTQYDKQAADLGTSWGTKPEVVKQVL